MGLETVKEEIISNAKNQEESLIAEAKIGTIRLINEEERKAARLKEKSDLETKRIIDLIKRQELSSAELESKKIFLETKKQLIESVFSEVRKNLEKLDSKKREEYVKKLLEKAKNDIEVANVYVNEKDKKFLENAESIEIVGGLIAENEDKTVRVDYSFDTILQSLKDNELQNINKILFGDS